MKRCLQYPKTYFVLAAFAFLCAGCGTFGNGLDSSGSIADMPSAGRFFRNGIRKSASGIGVDYYHDYKEVGGQVALVTDTGSVMDNGYNQAALEGAKEYALAAGVSYSFYSTESDSPEAYEDTVLYAIENQAKLIICAGSHFEQAVGSLQERYGDITFLLLDGVPRDASGMEMVIAPNVHCITYHEEEAGYLAGYMAVLEGYRKLGFIGGEQLPTICRYGYGYLQGIDDAAMDLDICDEVCVEYWYADTFSPSPEIKKTSRSWYEAGTEIIFVCGGSIYQSVLASAEKCNGMLIGADVDQSGISKHVLTSAMKGVQSSVIVALDELFAHGGSWPEDMAGCVMTYGAEKECIELPLTGNAWRFQNVSTKDYFRIRASLREGKVYISDDISEHPDTAVTVNYYNENIDGKATAAVGGYFALPDAEAGPLTACKVWDRDVCFLHLR